MSLSNIILTITVGGLFNYILVYRRHWFLGNIIFLLLGLLLAYQGSVLIITTESNIAVAVGIIIILSTIVNTIGGIISLSKS